MRRARRSGFYNDVFEVFDVQRRTVAHYILVVDFQTFEFRDLDKREMIAVALAELPSHVEAFGFILGRLGHVPEPHLGPMARRRAGSRALDIMLVRFLSPRCHFAVGFRIRCPRAASGRHGPPRDDISVRPDVSSEEFRMEDAGEDLRAVG